MDVFFECYVWWLILGILIGFFLFWLYDLLFRRDGDDDQTAIDDAVQQPSALASASTKTVAETVVTPLSAEPVEADLSSHMVYSADSLGIASGFGLKPSKGGKDNLTVVEGIGPKIAQLLTNDGIETFRQLENASESRLQGVLDAGGSSFQLAVPQSWPRQAGLCVTEEWQALKEYQDRLFNGVEVKD